MPGRSTKVISPPMRRTLALVLDELERARTLRNEYLGAGHIRWAGECCFDIEQLTQEYAALRYGEPPPFLG
jgi:hypothetical protein